LNTKKLIAKIAADKDSKKLGKIVKIENLPLKTTKKKVPYVIISYQRFMRRPIGIPLEVSKLLKVEGEYAWFDVSKKEFLEEVEQIKLIIKDRETNPEYIVHSKWYPIYHFDSRPRKDRKS